METAIIDYVVLEEYHHFFGHLVKPKWRPALLNYLRTFLDIPR